MFISIDFYRSLVYIYIYYFFYICTKLIIYFYFYVTCKVFIYCKYFLYTLIWDYIEGAPKRQEKIAGIFPVKHIVSLNIFLMLPALLSRVKMQSFAEKTKIFPNLFYRFITFFLNSYKIISFCRSIVNGIKC